MRPSPRCRRRSGKNLVHKEQGLCPEFVPSPFGVREPCSRFRRAKPCFARLQPEAWLRAPNRVLKKSDACFDRLSTNGKSPTIAMPVPFALSLSKGERRVFQHPAKAQAWLAHS